MQLVLLNDTLRLHDNPLLTAATGPCVAVVVLDKHSYFGRQYQLPRANLMRLQQQLGVIDSLKQTLAHQGIGLITLFGEVSQCLQQLACHWPRQAVIASEPSSVYQQAALNRLSSTVPLHLYDCNSLLGEMLRPDLSALADSFTPFRQSLEPLLSVAAPIQTQLRQAQWLSPEQTAPFNNAFNQLALKYQQPVHLSPADETHALNHCHKYLWQDQQIMHYKDTRNQLFGQHYASFFSTFLALGSLSVRYIWQEITRFEQDVIVNDSTYWLKFELLWREFFRWQCRKHGARWFSKNGIKGDADFRRPQLTTEQQQQFANWCRGDTGEAFIDANMRLLNKTGLMSNRGRQNVASYLIHDLALDWRLGAAYFEQRLLDYDCASNWGNWAYIAGVGNSQPRRFNIAKQAQQYDTNGDFIRHMLSD
jgi:deoxyribodipyrimidine photo-lyase